MKGLPAHDAWHTKVEGHIACHVTPAVEAARWARRLGVGLHVVCVRLSVARLSGDPGQVGRAAGQGEEAGLVAAPGGLVA